LAQIGILEAMILKNGFFQSHFLKSLPLKNPSARRRLAVEQNLFISGYLPSTIYLLYYWKRISIKKRLDGVSIKPFFHGSIDLLLYCSIASVTMEQ